MPKVKRSRKPPPDGWELIEPTLDELDQKMREGKSEVDIGHDAAGRHQPIVVTKLTSTIDKNNSKLYFAMPLAIHIVFISPCSK